MAVMPFTNNDMNLLELSPLISDILTGKFFRNATDEYNIAEDCLLRRMMYFMGDGTYQSWLLFAKKIHNTA